MAAGDGGRRRRSRWKRCLLFVEEIRRLDGSCDSYFVFKINVKDMFASAAAGEERDLEAMAMRNLPRPFARFDALPGRPECLDLAVVSAAGRRGTHIVAVSSDRRTVIYDAAAGTEVPCGRELRYTMTRGTTLIPLGTRLYAIATNLLPPSIYSDSRPSFQALVPPSQPSSSSSSQAPCAAWSWRLLPAPPYDLYRTGSGREKSCCHLTATLAAGNRVWVSAPDRGTFSFDAARRAWRKEGDWELPWERHGLLVPDLGLCFGVCPHRLCLCAFDAPTSGAGELPAIRHAFDETYPRECRDGGLGIFSPGSLNYLGGGRFCITWAIGIEYAGEDMVLSRLAFFLMAVQVGRCRRSGELRLVKLKVRCYKMSSSGVDGYVLQPSLS